MSILQLLIQYLQYPRCQIQDGIFSICIINPRIHPVDFCLDTMSVFAVLYGPGGCLSFTLGFKVFMEEVLLEMDQDFQ